MSTMVFQDHYNWKGWENSYGFPGDRDTGSNPNWGLLLEFIGKELLNFSWQLAKRNLDLFPRHRRLLRGTCEERVKNVGFGTFYAANVLPPQLQVGHHLSSLLNEPLPRLAAIPFPLVPLR